VRTRSTNETKSLKRRWKPSVEDEAIRQYRTGWSVRRVAKHWGVRTTEISELLAERGESLHPGGRGHPRFSTSSQCQEVATAYKSGLSLAALAKMFGCSTIPIARALKLADVDTVSKIGRPKVWTNERLNWIAAQYRSGRSQQSIADELGVVQTAVSGRLRQIGEIPAPDRSGPSAGAWKGGRHVTREGYVWVRPFADDLSYCVPVCTGYTQEHRLVMGKALGRPLTGEETVHHINGIKDDNRLENLQLRQGKHGTGVVMTCNACGSHDVRAAPLK
jgi:HNH endonuclease